MLPSEIPRLATDLLERVFPGLWKLLSFLRLPFQDGSQSLPLLSLFLIFYILPYLLSKTMGYLSGCWYPLPAFRSCFVEFTQHSNVLLMNLWGRKWSPCLIPPKIKTFKGNKSWENLVSRPVLRNVQVFHSEGQWYQRKLRSTQSNEGLQ